jgi:hypothetical protein
MLRRFILLNRFKIYFVLFYVKTFKTISKYEPIDIH